MRAGFAFVGRLRWVTIRRTCYPIGGVTYTGVVVYLRRTLEGPFFLGGAKIILCTFFWWFFVARNFPQKFLPPKNQKKYFFDFGAPEPVRAVMGSLCAQK